MSGARTRVTGYCLAALLAFSSAAIPSADAFPYVVQPDDTLAGIAREVYGKIQNERLISTANALDERRVRGLSPGQILEIPALRYERVAEGDTWESLAQTHLGHEARALLLAQVNGHKPWIQPELGQLIALPYNLTWVASGEDSLATLAYRFLGSTKHSYRLLTYNQLEDQDIARGTTLLLPIVELELTDRGRELAREASARLESQGWGPRHEQALVGHSATDEVASDVRAGRYISALSRGNQLLGQGVLSEPDQATTHRLLLEAYTALGAEGPARTACETFRGLTPEVVLDPLTTSPKILRLCPNPAKAPPSPSAPTAAED